MISIPKPVTYLLPLGLAVCALLPRLLLYPYLDQRSAFILFTLAVITSAWYGGWRLGLLATGFSGLLGAYFVLRPFEVDEGDYIADAIEIALFSLSGVGISWIAEQLRSAQRRAEANERAAREALSQVKALSGLLPICAACKKIRNRDGSWSHIETYIRSHSEADFTHGICPQCFDRLYPDFKGSA